MNILATLLRINGTILDYHIYYLGFSFVGPPVTQTLQQIAIFFRYFFPTTGLSTIFVHSIVLSDCHPYSSGQTYLLCVVSLAVYDILQLLGCLFPFLLIQSEAKDIISTKNMAVSGMNPGPPRVQVVSVLPAGRVGLTPHERTDFNSWRESIIKNKTKQKSVICSRFILTPKSWQYILSWLIETLRYPVRKGTFKSWNHYHYLNLRNHLLRKKVKVLDVLYTIVTPKMKKRRFLVVSAYTRMRAHTYTCVCVSVRAYMCVSARDLN